MFEMYAYFAIILPGSATLSVCKRGVDGANVAVGLEVSISCWEESCRSNGD